MKNSFSSVFLLTLWLVTLPSSGASLQEAISNLSLPKLNTDFCENTLVKSTEIVLDGIESASDRSLLRKDVRGLVNALKGHLPMPAKIAILDDENIGPYQSDGKIWTRFPFWSPKLDIETDTVTKIYKIPAQSLPITVHEIAHQLLEVYVRTHQESAPIWVWAYYSRTDGEFEKASLKYIEESKAKVGLAGFSAQEILNHFFMISVHSSYFDEYLAEILPTLYYGDPDAIYNSIHFEEIPHEIPYTRYRRYDLQLKPSIIGEIKDKTYDVTLIAKTFVWQELYKRFEDGRINMKLGEFVRRIMTSTLETNASLTNGFSQDIRFELDPVQFNTALISKLCFDFNVEPCVAQVIGKVTKNQYPKWKAE